MASGSTWQASSYTANNNNCVEVRVVEGVIELRESDDGEVIVHTTAARFAAFLQGAKAGAFDHLTTDA
ncbi:DUF397 domain-containing protein [Streptomyces sp. FH025]|uniref:DUF397 domain-containing protein n=1 Tax=Streptomyces sp. FH025 TaxID=2815937 RepID=UPI001A9D17C8|nr:DUF397 domain-containing protein [Streptomyces sp. FH025]MBO1413315.1 DUF397 domain-containing protein [Streptomyces sp. FH025]